MEVVHVDGFGTLFKWAPEVTDAEPDPVTSYEHRAFEEFTRFELELTLAFLHSAASHLRELSQ